MAENTETLDIKQFQLHGKDTGSADVQVALLTRRIGQFTEHLKSHAKDHSSRRGLLKIVAQREEWSLAWLFKCSVNCPIRRVNSATWTSALPVSLPCNWNCLISSVSVFSAISKRLF